jgi:hypothetical protein
VLVLNNDGQAGIMCLQVVGGPSLLYIRDTVAAQWLVSTTDS